MEGYILEHRKIMQWQWYKDIAVAHLFRHLILRANYINAAWKGIIINRGQLVTSRQTLSFETGLTEKVVRRCLKVLVRTGEISIKTTNQYTLITICNYSEYQAVKSEGNNGMASKGPRKDQRKATNKEREENNKSEFSLRSNSSSVQAPTISDDKIDHQAFMDFFNKEMADKAIPRIIQMNKSRKGMLNARVREYGKEAVAMVVRKAAASTWLNGGGNYVASYDWLFKPNNFIKVLEGNYDDHRSNSLPASEQPCMKSKPTNSNTSIIPSTNNSFKYNSYEQHRKDEQQKRLKGYSEAVSEILERR